MTQFISKKGSHLFSKVLDTSAVLALMQNDPDSRTWLVRDETVECTSVHILQFHD